MSLLASLLLFNSLHGPLLAPSPSLPADSIGQEMRGGQRLVRHRVGQGETLFALARRYHVTVDQITAANPQLKSGLGIGEIVLVPRPGGGARTAAATKVPATTAAAATVPARYTVAKGETLFGIARRFNLSPSELMELNHLPAGGAVRVGQELQLKAAGSGPVSTAAVPPATVPAATAPKVNPTAPAQVATVTPAAPKESKEGREEATEARSPTHASELAHRVTESGIASSIAGGGTDKYLALHKTAPVGTIMEIKNQMNGQRVYVRVIGALPSTGENDNVLVRLSPRAVQKLGTNDAKFRVETSYIP
ncbi:MAG: LysM peptidoglycan-binding domain-containing protein [Janthinobacterium lividum]